MNIAGKDSQNIAQFVRAHNQANDGMRLGQRFVNLYIKQPMPDLFYEKSDKEAMKMISDWLTKHHYINTMPKPINRE